MSNDIPVPRTTAPASPSGAERRLRVGFITHLDQHDESATIYRDNISLIARLEELGYDSAWIATRHFHSGWAALPSPFAFLGAAAQATSRIHLGTAVLPLLVDDPVRDAEDAAVLDWVSGGRLQLGVGKGVPSDAYHVFQKWGGERDVEFDAKVDLLQWALEGNTVEGSHAAIWPANHDLTGRLYVGTSNRETIRRSARNGQGLILERFGNNPHENSPEGRGDFLERQADSIRDYREEFARTWASERTPYVVLSRSAYPGTLEQAHAATERWYEYSARAGRAVPGRASEDALLADNVVWGEDPEELAEKIFADPSVALSDELLLGLHPAELTVAETAELAERLIHDVFPLVAEKWKHAQASEGDSRVTREVEDVVR